MNSIMILMLVVVLLNLIVLGFAIFKVYNKSQPMAGTDPQSVDKQGRYPWEFWLVVVMLVALLSLIMAILLPPVPQPDISLMPEGAPRAAIVFKDLLEYNNMQLENRKDILAIIITAFGAWVGAGAAYFFGRENLRAATEGLLAMREVSPKERLRRTSIKQIPPTPLDWTVPITTLVDDVKAKLMTEPNRWFIPIVKADGTLETVINEEAVYRFLLNTETPPVAGDTVEKLLAYIDSKPELIRFKQIYVPVTMDATVGAANELMEGKSVFLAIVETDGKPTHFFTTAEVRKLLLQGG